MFNSFSGLSDTFREMIKKIGLTVLIEALASGCPAVATDCVAGPSEILLDGQFGKLVSVSDPSGMASSILETLSEPIDRSFLFYRANKFSDTNISQKALHFLSVYKY